MLTGWRQILRFRRRRNRCACPLPAAPRLSLPRGHGGGVGVAAGMTAQRRIRATCRRRGFQRVHNVLQYPIPIVEDVAVPKAEDAPASAPQESVSSIMVTRNRVSASVSFDNELGLDTS